MKERSYASLTKRAGLNKLLQVFIDEIQRRGYKVVDATKFEAYLEDSFSQGEPDGWEEWLYESVDATGEPEDAGLVSTDEEKE